MARGKKTSIYINDTYLEKIGAAPYTSKKTATARSNLIDRHFYVYKLELKIVLSKFKKNELGLIKDICRNIEWQPAEKLHDGILHQIQLTDEKEFVRENISKSELEDKLRSLTLPQQFILVEALERGSVCS